MGPAHRRCRRSPHWRPSPHSPCPGCLRCPPPTKQASALRRRHCRCSILLVVTPLASAGSRRVAPSRTHRRPDHFTPGVAVADLPAAAGDGRVLVASRPTSSSSSSRLGMAARLPRPSMVLWPSLWIPLACPAGPVWSRCRRALVAPAFRFSPWPRRPPCRQCCGFLRRCRRTLVAAPLASVVAGLSSSAMPVWSLRPLRLRL